MSFRFLSPENSLRRAMRIRALTAVSITVLCCGLSTIALGAAAPDERLEFQVKEGRNINCFIRDGKISAHALLRSGRDPRIMVVFPAGNSGTGLWFGHVDQKANWQVPEHPQPITLRDAKGRPLYGIVMRAVIDTPDLTIKQAILSSVRILRDPQKATMVDADIQGDTLTWERERMDGVASYRVSVQVTHGALKDQHILAGSDGKIALKIIAASGEKPLTPLVEQALLNDSAAADPAARKVLAFLSYQEKFLAGSWRYNTYFGRDTLMTIRLLMPALQPAAVDAGLGSVFARLSPDGEVAHEEDVGEMAVLDHQKRDGSSSDAPTFDYGMIDGSFLLAPVASAWLLDDARGRAGAASFLAKSDHAYGKAPRTVGADLVSNLRFVLMRTTAFFATPTTDNLIGLKPDRATGQWRDSDDGLGDGHYPYDVNAVLVPAALEAASRFYASGLLNPYLSADDRVLFAQAMAAATIWRTKAPSLFEVDFSPEAADARIRSYAASLGVPAVHALDNGTLRFHALSLDATGRPVPIMHSDEGFALMFDAPDAASLDRTVSVLMRPFPAGLMTGAGMVVANPAFASKELQDRLGPGAYHGAVVWSWQQALFAAGLERQLQRKDLPHAVRRHLMDAQKTLWTAIAKTRSMHNSELWSWIYRDGRYQVVPFGTGGADADESNAAQLWSTVYLALHAPQYAK